MMSLAIAHTTSSGSIASGRIWIAFLKRLSCRARLAALRASRRTALRRARRDLLELPDYMLADIGISRGEIASAVEYGRPGLGRLERPGAL